MDALGLTQLVLGLRLTRYAIIATYALLLYEYLIIFHREYETIYKSCWSLTKCLYLACRFSLLLGWPFAMYAFLVDHDMESCKPILVIITALFMLFPCFPQCISVLRAYAITGAKRWSLLVYLPSLFVYFFVVCRYSLDQMTLWEDAFLRLGRTGCFRSFPHKYDSFSRIIFTAIALDSIVGLMLVTHFIWSHSPRTGLGKLLIKQGLVYFLLMFLLNSGAAIVSSIGTFRGYDALAFSAVIPIANIMACRFIIQTREYALNNPIFSITGRETVESTFPTSSFSPGQHQTHWQSVVND